jgi:hypothetical protein
VSPKTPLKVSKITIITDKPRLVIDFLANALKYLNPHNRYVYGIIFLKFLTLYT